MIPKNLVQLGDILVFKSGKMYIYLKCPEIGYCDNDFIVLLKCSGDFYFGSGLGCFTDSLYCDITRDQVVKIYRPINPIIFVKSRSFYDPNIFFKLLNESVQIYPECNFLFLDNYV